MMVVGTRFPVVMVMVFSGLCALFFMATKYMYVCLFVCPQVSTIDSLSLTPVSLAKATATPTQSAEHAFPLGYSAHFAAHLHDSVGRRFDYGGMELSYRLSRLDIVHVTPGLGNDSYIVKAARQGNTILKVCVL